MLMRPTRKIIAEFIGVFLIGAVAGGLVTKSYTGTELTTFMSKAADKPDAIVARMNKKYADEYHLSPDEIAKIQPLVQELAQHIYQVRHQFGLDIMSTLDDYHAKIAEQLTPEHRDAYEKAMADRHKKLGSMLLPDSSVGADNTK
jgi:uncharacterized membrane protein